MPCKIALLLKNTWLYLEQYNSDLPKSQFFESWAILNEFFLKNKKADFAQPDILAAVQL